MIVVCAMAAGCAGAPPIGDGAHVLRDADTVSASAIPDPDAPAAAPRGATAAPVAVAPRGDGGVAPAGRAQGQMGFGLGFDPMPRDPGRYYVAQDRNGDFVVVECRPLAVLPGVSPPLPSPPAGVGQPVEADPQHIDVPDPK
jgi:hypothetical protein